MENKRAAELKKLVIIVGKEPSQNDVKWAKELQEKLYDQYDLKVKIGGNMPEGFVDIFTIKKCLIELCLTLKEISHPCKNVLFKNKRPSP